MPERDTDSPAPASASSTSAPAATAAAPVSVTPAPTGGTFARRLALAFAVVAALTALLSAMLISAAWNRQFDEYLKDNLQHLADGVAQIASEAYPVYGGWSLQTLYTIPRSGAVRGINVQVLDDTGDVIYDEAALAAEQQSAIHGSAMSEEDFVLEPEGPVVTAPVKVDGQTVGTVRVWAYGQGAVMTDRDEQFRSASLAALTIAALIAIVLSSLAGAWYANRLVRPIEAITAVARALRRGDREARTKFEGEDEISVLGRTFDEMADAIEADRQLERRLTADVAHELRTPLQAIQATVEAMQDGVLPADEERLGIVRNETVRLARLADAILELTRLERGSLPFDMRDIDLSETLHAAVGTHEALFEGFELTLTTSIAEGLTVNGDSDRLQQAIGNLLSNAARYTPAGGSVEVSLYRDGSEAVIDVADTGIGISDEDLPKVFGRFWRADSARAAATGGVGVGLAVTKEIVERHRGIIGVAQRPEGGALFSIRLPLV